MEIGSMASGQDRLNALIARRTSNAKEFIYKEQQRELTRNQNRKVPRSGLEASFQTHLERVERLLRKIMLQRVSPNASLGDSKIQAQTLQMAAELEALKECIWKHRGRTES